MNLIKELRTIAQQRTKPEERKTLRDMADALHSAVKKFSEHHTDRNLTLVNGLWSRAYRILQKLPPEDTSPSPQSGYAEEKRRIAA